MSGDVRNHVGPAQLPGVATQPFPASQSALWLRVDRPRPRATARLVCFPHAGGSASFFRTWSAKVPYGVELVAVQYPGHGDRISEPFANSLGSLADGAAAELRTTTVPVILFGHSLGASVAFEVARRLERYHSPKLLGLVVSGREAPHRQRATNVHQSDDDRMLEEIAALGGTDTAAFAYPELRQLMAPILRSDLQLSETYHFSPGPALTCKLIACRGNNDPEVDVEEATAWREYTECAFDLITLPGNHFYLIDQVEVLIAQLWASLGGMPAAQTGWPSTP